RFAPKLTGARCRGRSGPRGDPWGRCEGSWRTALCSRAAPRGRRCALPGAPRVLVAPLSGPPAPPAPPAPGPILPLGESVFVKLEVRDDTGHVTTEFPFGTAFHPSATVSGFSGTPTGTVVFRKFATADCSGSPNDVS